MTDEQWLAEAHFLAKRESDLQELLVNFLGLNGLIEGQTVPLMAIYGNLKTMHAFSQQAEVTHEIMKEDDYEEWVSKMAEEGVYDMDIYR